MTTFTTFTYSDLSSSTSSESVLDTTSYDRVKILTAVDIRSGVTTIFDGCFRNDTGRVQLSSVIIPNSVTSLGAGCFRDVTTLTSVQIGSGVTVLGANCFDGCTNLSSINIPNSVTSLGNRCFSANSNLSSIIIHDGVTSFGDDCFSGCIRLTSATIGSGVATMNGTFFSCRILSSVTIRSGVTPLIIGNATFYQCYQLTSIIIPDRVTSLGDACFYECVRLSSIQIGKNVSSMNNNCFNLCYNLRTLTFENQTNFKGPVGTVRMFNNCPSMNVTYYLTERESELTTSSKTLKSQMPVGSTFHYDASCFNEGTKILCLNKNFEEEYIPIQNLRKGDLVKSYKHGYRKIDLIGKNTMINNPEKCLNCMYKMEKTEENGLLEDLIITGGHSILVDDLGVCKEENDKLFSGVQIIDDKYLLLSAVSKEFIKLENTNPYTYYHFILENNENDDERFGVWANGVLTETPSKKQFMKKF